MRHGGSPLAARRRRLMRLAVLLHWCRLRLRAIDKTFRACFRTLRPFGPLRTREALRAFMPVAAILAVAPIMTRAAILARAAITTIAAAIAILPVIAIVAALAVAMLRTSVVAHAGTAVVIARAIVVARLAVMIAHLRLRLRHGAEITAAEIVTVLVAELIARSWLAAKRCRTDLTRAVLHVAALGYLLFAERQDDAVIMLGVLEIVLSQNGIAARLRISRQRHVFSAICEGVPRILTSGPVLSKLRVKGF